MTIAKADLVSGYANLRELYTTFGELAAACHSLRGKQLPHAQRDSAQAG